MWLLFLAAAAVRTAAGDFTPLGCDWRMMGCDFALGSYYITPDQNLTYISSLFGIQYYADLAPYNPGYPNLDYMAADSRVNVCFPCRCLALQFPFHSIYTILAGSFPYLVSQQGESFTSIAALYHNLTTPTLLQNATMLQIPRNVDDALDAGTVVNVTVPCSCATDVSRDYTMLLTYPLSDGETPDSAAASYGLSSQAEVELFRRYNPHEDSAKEGEIVYIPLKGR